MDGKGIDTVVINSRVFIDKKDVWVIALTGLCSEESKIAHKVFAQNCKLYSNNHLKYKVNFSQLPLLS